MESHLCLSNACLTDSILGLGASGLSEQQYEPLNLISNLRTSREWGDLDFTQVNCDAVFVLLFSPSGFLKG